MDRDVLVRVENLKKWFPIKRTFIEILRGAPRRYLHAVDDISFDIYRGEIFTLAGESGCGKTTTGRLLLRLIEPTSGKVFFEGKNIYDFDKKELKSFRRVAQIIFQDPYESLNPRMTVFDIVSEPLAIHKTARNEAEKIEYVIKSLEDVGLTPPEEFLFRYPHQLSGGQRQRVAIATATILEPKFIVADEPVSMLDMSIRASILNILLDMKEKKKVSFLFITHDLAVAKYVSDRIAIMYLGKIVEMGKATEVIDNPLHPYSRALIEAIPSPNPKVKMKIPNIKGEVTSPIDPPKRCRFYERCPFARGICEKSSPALVEFEKGHFVSCFLYSDEVEK